MYTARADYNTAWGKVLLAIDTYPPSNHCLKPQMHQDAELAKYGGHEWRNLAIAIRGGDAVCLWQCALCHQLADDYNLTDLLLANMLNRHDR